MDASLVSQIILAISTLLASLGGYVLAGINESRRDERATRRELELRALERDAHLDEAEHDFQRETLLALQDALQVMARLSGKAMHFDHMQARNGSYTQLPEDLNNDLHANGVEVRRLASRVLDTEIRESVREFASASAQLTTSPKDLMGMSGERLEEYALTKGAEFTAVYEATSELLGNAIRAEIAWRPRIVGREVALRPLG